VGSAAVIDTGGDGGDVGGDRDAMLVVNVMMMMIMVMVLGTLTQVPFHDDLATLLLALSIPAPPTIHT
jgi:hypothetical protein